VDITPLAPDLAAPGTAETIEAERRRIVRDGFNVFDGELRTNDGRIIGVDGQTLSDGEIQSGIDWYYHTVSKL
jgi:basic membrane protein A